MPKVTIRYQQLGDAKDFYNILSNPHFIYFPAKPQSVEEEKKYLKTVPQLRKINKEWNYTILNNGQVVGAVGIKISTHRNFIGEIGYFIDEKFWGQGIATKAVELAEKEGFDKLGLSRLEIVMQPEHKASEKVAIKAGYKLEGEMQKAITGTDGKKKNALLYAKVKDMD